MHFECSFCPTCIPSVKGEGDKIVINHMHESHTNYAVDIQNIGKDPRLNAHISSQLRGCIAGLTMISNDQNIPMSQRIAVRAAAGQDEMYLNVFEERLKVMMNEDKRK